jgi:hypothetical protein
MAQALGRVVNPSALDECSEPRGRHAIEIPAEWIGAEILVAVPARVVCARCDGGGCDGCHRRGGHRLEGDEDARAVRVQLPRAIHEVVVLRLVYPFGDVEGSIRQLHLEARVGLRASSGVVLCALATREPAPGVDPKASTSPMAPGSSESRHVALVVALVFALGILTALATMR